MDYLGAVIAQLSILKTKLVWDCSHVYFLSVFNLCFVIRRCARIPSYVVSTDAVLFLQWGRECSLYLLAESPDVSSEFFLTLDARRSNRWIIIRNVCFSFGIRNLRMPKVGVALSHTHAPPCFNRRLNDEFLPEHQKIMTIKFLSKNKPCFTPDLVVVCHYGSSQTWKEQLFKYSVSFCCLWS